MKKSIFNKMNTAKILETSIDNYETKSIEQNDPSDINSKSSVKSR